MTPIQWFFSGGAFMWPIVFLVVMGSAFALASLTPRTRTDNEYSSRRGVGIALVAIALLCFGAGFAGYSQSQARIDVFVEEDNVTDPELLAMARREARIPLEASVVPGVIFLGLGLLAARRGRD